MRSKELGKYIYYLVMFSKKNLNHVYVTIVIIFKLLDVGSCAAQEQCTNMEDIWMFRILKI